MAASICLSPLLWVYRHALVQIPVQIWGLILLTGFCQSIYFIGLAGAYRHGQLSIAYPLARSLPVFIVTLISVVFKLGSPISWAGYIGILLIVCGCLLIPLQTYSAFKLRSYLNLYCFLALMAACGTAGYTLIDNEALRQIRSLPGLAFNAVETALLYMVLETLLTTLVLSIYVLSSPEQRTLFGNLRRTSWRSAAVTGIIINLTYGLVLIAMAYVTNISYLAAFRELSIPIGAFLGISLQKEPAFKPKLVGIGIVMAGLLLVGLTS